MFYPLSALRHNFLSGFFCERSKIQRAAVWFVRWLPSHNYTNIHSISLTCSTCSDNVLRVGCLVLSGWQAALLLFHFTPAQSPVRPRFAETKARHDHTDQDGNKSKEHIMFYPRTKKFFYLKAFHSHLVSILHLPPQLILHFPHFTSSTLLAPHSFIPTYLIHKTHQHGFDTKRYPIPHLHIALTHSHRQPAHTT